VNRKISEEIVEEYLVRIETNDGWGTFNLALPNISMTNLILKNVSGLSGVGTAKIAFVEDFSLWFEAQSELMETRLASARSFERPKLREIQNA
jgi:hypothetical protein